MVASSSQEEDGAFTHKPLSPIHQVISRPKYYRSAWGILIIQKLTNMKKFNFRSPYFNTAYTMIGGTLTAALLPPLRPMRHER